MTRLPVIFSFALLVTTVSAHAQVSPMECQLLPVQSAKDGDKNDPNYKPGVDVKGKPVVPADLNAPPNMVPRTIVVPLSIDLAQRLRSANVEGLDLKAPVGMLEIHPNGRVVYDGKDLTSQVYVSCGRETIPDLPDDKEVLEAAETKPSTPTEGDGQPAGDALESEAVEVRPVPAVPPKSEMIEGGESRYEGYR